jgi:hypothetical protein
MDSAAGLGFLRLVFVLVALGACRSEHGEHVARDALRPELVGYYALFGDDGQAVDSAYYNASPLVRLDTSAVGVTPHDDRPGVLRVLHRLDAAGRRLDAFDSRTAFGPVWSADSLTDSIRISFSDGFSGAYFVLAASVSHLDTLRGHAEEHWDFGPPTGRGRARAVRVRCASSPGGNVASRTIRVPQN